MKNIIVLGLAIYSISSSLGLFLSPDPFGLTMMIWLAGYVLLAFIVFYSSFVSRETLKAFPYITIGVILLNFLVQITGGIHSSAWPVYFLFAVFIAAFSKHPLGNTYTTVSLILGIETANLLAPKQVPEFRWAMYVGYSLSLAVVSLVTAHIMNHTRSKERQVREDHEQLLAHANAVDPLSDKSKLSALTQVGQQAANVDAALRREVTFNGLLEFIYELVPAHTYALFLREQRDGKDVLALRAIRSESHAVAKIGALPDRDLELEQWIIGSCAKNREPKYIDDMTLPTTTLGYYQQEVLIRSFFAFPIVDGSANALGVLAVDSLEKGAFSTETRQVLERFTPFFIQIIERIQIARELNVRASHFESLHEMGRVLNSSLDLDAILDRLTALLTTMVPNELCVFLRYDEKAREAIVLHLSGSAIQRVDRAPFLEHLISSFKLFFRIKGEDQTEQPFPVAQSGILSQMLKQWENGRILAYHFPDLGERSKEVGLFGESNRLQQKIHTLSCWPLVAGEKFIGAFFLGSTRSDAFSEPQRNFLDTLMNQVAVVMDNVILHQQIRNMALTDGLTGLLNHRTFMENVDAEFLRLNRDPQPFSLLLVDIDFFKKVNDTYGHPVGDIALKSVAGIIRKQARTIDFVARYGGEEFAIGMLGSDSAGAHLMAERIRETVEKTAIIAGDRSFFCTLSIGIATLLKSGEKREGLIARADAALYHAKHSGRNRVCLHEDIIKAATPEDA